MSGDAHIQAIEALWYTAVDVAIARAELGTMPAPVSCTLHPFRPGRPGFLWVVWRARDFGDTSPTVGSRCIGGGTTDETDAKAAALLALADLIATSAALDVPGWPGAAP
jgi:hypothetical protein